MLNKIQVFSRNFILNEINKMEAKSVINIPYKLYQDGVLCDADILYKNSVNLTILPRRFDILRKYFQLIKPIIFFIYYSTCLITLNVKGYIPSYFCDVLVYFPGAITQFFYVMAICGCFVTFNTKYVFIFSEKSDYQWIRVFDVLKSYEESVEPKDETQREMSSLIRKVKTLALIFQHFLTFLTLFTICISTYLSVTNLIMNNQLVYGLGVILILPLYVYTTALPYFLFVLCFYTVSNYCQSILKLFNKSLNKQNFSLFVNNRRIESIIANHNTICSEIIGFNRFWSRIYSGLIYTTIPIAQLLLHQLLFTNMNNVILFTLIAGASVLMLLSNFVLNLITASIYNQANHSYKAILNFINNHQDIKLKHKLKVMYFYWVILKLIFFSFKVDKFNGKDELQYS